MWAIIQGDARRIPLGDETVQCVVTSPPFWGLRDYGIGDDAIGLEATPDLYIEHLVEIFREVRRVLRKDGTVWCNLGDSYSGSTTNNRHTMKWETGGNPTPPEGTICREVRQESGLKPKDLCGIPWRVALALQADGWWLRSDIIWSKPNPMPESVQGSHYARHRVKISEYENLSRLQTTKGESESRSGNLSDLSAREVPRGETQVSTDQERTDDGAGERGARRGKGEAATIQQVVSRETEQGPLRSDGQSQGGTQKTIREISKHGTRQAESGREASADKKRFQTNSPETSCESALYADRQLQGQKAERIRQEERGNSTFSNRDSRGLVADSQSTQESLLLLQEEKNPDDGSCDPGEQGRKACEGEYSARLSELQFDEGEQDDNALVDCPGCPKCNDHGGYVLRMAAGRPTRSHEYIFLLTKSASYHYDADAVREPHQDAKGIERFKGGCGIGKRNLTQGWSGDDVHLDKHRDYNPTGRNLRSVWNIPTQPFPEAHFATFPQALVEPCIKAGTSEKGCCVECGSPWERVVEKSGGTTGQSWHDHSSDNAKGQRSPNTLTNSQDGSYKVQTLGWQPTCKHNTEISNDLSTSSLKSQPSGYLSTNPIPCLVLDPFAGSGTTGVVCLKLGRSFVGIELKAEYTEMANKRVFNSGSLLDFG